MRNVVLAAGVGVSATLLVVLVEAVAHEMVNDRVWTFATTAAIATVAPLLAARRFFLEVLIPYALAFGGYW